MKNRIIIAIISAFVMVSSLNLKAQEGTEKPSPSMVFTYLRMADGNLEYTARLLLRTDSGAKKLKNMPVQFLFRNDSGEVKLTEATTDNDGYAILRIHKDYPIFKDNDGFYTVIARFEETKELASAEDEIRRKNLDMNMELTEVDSVKTVNITVTWDSAGNKMPLNGVDVIVSVQRMFSLLKVGEGTLENGQISVEFPADLVGDVEGNLEIVARIEDHDDFGTVDVRKRINWGLPEKFHKREFQRELWTPVAPIWMIVTLIIMLSGVWGHYIYVFFSIRSIKKLGKE